MDRIAAVVLGVFLVTVGVTHFALPGYFRSLVPRRLPRPALLVAVSGGAEVVVGGWAAAVLTVRQPLPHRLGGPGRAERPSRNPCALSLKRCV
ncbi:hypothetical protein ACFV9W_33235 [Streptomyces sp. NPDC059897]|uniref:hypothetical protein n=1 Tax=Streptomyces sp. NPDC059897 TaxID=3346994 RepID=UPI00365B54FE